MNIEAHQMFNVGKTEPRGSIASMKSLPVYAENKSNNWLRQSDPFAFNQQQCKFKFLI